MVLGCNVPLVLCHAFLRLPPKKIVIGGKSGCTIRDTDPIVNGFDFGICSVTQKPCKGCIKLTSWQNYKEDIDIEGARALTATSIIPCCLGGVVSFVKSGQMKVNKVTNGAERAKSEHGEACEEKAKLQVAKVSFNSDYDICSDDYCLIWEKRDKDGNVIERKTQSESDYIKTYVLEDAGNYYHWLNKRTNPLDKVKFKPDPIPVTFAGAERVVLKAFFNTVSDKKFGSVPKIRAIHKRGDKEKYEFETVSVAKKSDDTYEAVVQSTNWPFEERIKYISRFELLFEYSEDGQTWLKAGTTRNTLYITWRKPLYDKFDKEDDENVDLIDMQIINTKTKRKLMLETLLWLGCTNAPDKKLLPKDEEDVVRSIFAPFKNKRVIRTREGTQYLNINWSKEGLGYWRGKSAIGGDPDFRSLRSVRYLLQYGEARCGEWSDFFLHLLLTQGISVNKDKDRCAIVTDYINTSKLNDLSINRLRNSSVVFTVKDAIFTKNSQNTKEYVIKGKSEAKGNDDAQPYFADHVWVYFRQKFFLDPSYGIMFEEKESTIEEYCKKCITSIFMEKGDSKEYAFIYSAQLKGFILFKDFHNYIVPSHRKLF